MTLVEVLVTLVLVSLVAALIWTTVSVSMKYNITETKKLRLQQEMNYIITKLQQEHRQRDCYGISVKEEKISIENCAGDSPYEEVISSGFLYSPLRTQTVIPKSEDLDLGEIVISDPENKKLNVKVETLISRYKTD